jgi:hypothetical protein
MPFIGADVCSVRVPPRLGLSVGVDAREPGMRRHCLEAQVEFDVFYGSLRSERDRMEPSPIRASIRPRRAILPGLRPGTSMKFQRTLIDVPV